MRKSIEMPEVIKCDAKGCAYNLDSNCHAKGITIGDMDQRHMCDTVWTARIHTHQKESGGVGACRATNCVHNEDLECQADGITVSLSGCKVQCSTFSAR